MSPKKEKKLKSVKKPPAWAIVILALVAFFVLTSFIPISSEEKIPLSQAVKEINEGKVEEITIRGNRIELLTDEGVVKTSLKEPGVGATEALSDLGAEKEKLETLEITFEEENDIWSWLGPIALTLLPSLLIFFLFWKVIKSAKSNATAAFDFTEAKARLFGADKDKEEEQTSFEDVGGLEQAKKELKEVVDFLKNPEKYFQIGAKIPRGVLLVGPPGTGKTLLARAVANEAGVPFFSIAGSEFIELFVGVGASRVRSLFSQAKKAGKAIIFIDELDSIGKSRGMGLRGGGLEEREQTLNQILTEMDGFERRSEVIVMGATNKPEALDKALLRPGRFDRRIVLDPPDIKDREKILEIHARGKPLAENVDLREIAERTPGFSGADLENLVNEAAILAARKDEKKIRQEHLLAAIEKVMLGPERESHLLNKKEKRVAAYHEAGHALVASSLGEEKVRKVSIIARGLATGYTLKMPEEEKRLKVKRDFLNQITILFGGYMAEKMKFGEVSTGASNDLQKATKIAQKLVKKYGMSPLGPIAFEEENEGSFERKVFGRPSYSEKTAARIDKEIEKILNRGSRNAEKVLKNKKETLEKLAKELTEKETLERADFEEIVKNKLEGEAENK